MSIGVAIFEEKQLIDIVCIREEATEEVKAGRFCEDAIERKVVALPQTVLERPNFGVIVGEEVCENLCRCPFVLVQSVEVVAVFNDLLNSEK